MTAPIRIMKRSSVKQPYAGVKDDAAAADTVMIRAQREAASEAEEAKYKK